MHKICLIILIIISSVLSSHLFAEPNGHAEAGSVLQLGNDHFKCGFPSVMQASFGNDQEKINQINKSIAESSKLTEVFVSPSGRFKIHYETSGFNAIPSYDRDANGIPDYLEFVAKSFDRAWEIEIDSLGFLPPPDLQGNPRSDYDIYCLNLNYYGSTWWDTNPAISEIPSLPGLNYVTSIDISTYFGFVDYPNVTSSIVRDSMAIAVTAAHEFNHALQAGYRLWGDSQGSFFDLWFIESSAVFMEEVVAPEVNDYLFYLPSYLRKTNRSIDDSDHSLVVYGRVLFPLMLGQKFGKAITREIWTEIKNQRALPAIETVLQNYDNGVSESIGDLAEWIYFSGERAIANEYFADAALFDELEISTESPLSISSQQIITDVLPRNAFQWYESAIPSSRNYQLLLKNLGENPEESLFLLEQTQNYIVSNANGPLLLPQTTSLSAKYAVVNRRIAGPEEFSFEVLSASVGDVAEVYPQPFKYASSTPQLNFDKLPAGAEIYIYSANGKLLWSDKIAANSTQYHWDIRTTQGNLVGSGVYIYQAKSDEKNVSGKFVIIR